MLTPSSPYCGWVGTNTVVMATTCETTTSDKAYNSKTIYAYTSEGGGGSRDLRLKAAGVPGREKQARTQASKQASSKQHDIPKPIPADLG